MLLARVWDGKQEALPWGWSGNGAALPLPTPLILAFDWDQLAELS